MTRLLGHAITGRNVRRESARSFEAAPRSRSRYGGVVCKRSGTMSRYGILVSLGTVYFPGHGSTHYVYIRSKCTVRAGARPRSGRYRNRWFIIYKYTRGDTRHKTKRKDVRRRGRMDGGRLHTNKADGYSYSHAATRDQYPYE